MMREGQSRVVGMYRDMGPDPGKKRRASEALMTASVTGIMKRKHGAGKKEGIRIGDC